MRENRILSILVSVGTLLGIAFGAYFYIDSNYAKAAEMQKIEQRLDYKIKSDQSKEVQQRIWLLEDRYYHKNMPESTKEEYRELKEEKKTLEGELNNLQRGK